MSYLLTLWYLIALIKQYDPDVFIGHNFIGFDLDVLLHRLRTLKIKDWSCLGRLRRTMYVNFFIMLNEKTLNT